MLEMQETQVRSLGGEDHLEEETHSSVLAWKFPGVEQPESCSLWGHKV